MYNNISSMAQSAADTFKNSLQYLVDAQNQQKLLDEQTAAQRYQNLLTQINQQRDPINQQYAQDSQSAYINKMLAGKQVGQTLNQLGLNTQGFGVSQMLQNETAYGQNLNQLTLGKNQALQNLDNQSINATGDYNADMLALSSTYAGRSADLQKYIGEQSLNKYNTVYSQLAEAKAYEDQLAQIAWENDYKNKQLAEQKRQARGGGGGPVFGDGSKDLKIDAFGNNQATQNKNNYFFSNGFQPRYINNSELVKSGQKAGIFDLGKSGVDAGNNVWTTNGKYYVWSGTAKDYIDVTTQMNQYLGKQAISSALRDGFGRGGGGSFGGGGGGGGSR